MRYACLSRWYKSFVCVSWHRFYKSFIFVTWRIHMCTAWLIHICDMTHLYVRHDTLVVMCDMTHLYLWNYLFICVTWLIHMCDMRLDLFICVTNLTSACTEYRVATISRLLKITGLFCRRALSKRLYSTNEAYHCILQKSPMILRSLIIVAAPYHTIMNAMEWLQLVRSLKL